MAVRRNTVVAALLVATLLAAVLGYLANARFDRALRAVTSGAPRVCARQPRRAHPARAPGRARRAGAAPQPDGEQLHERLSEGAAEKRRTEAILQAMEEGLLAVDHRGTVLLANEALLSGLGLQNPLGRHYIESIRHREVDDVITRVLSYGQREAAEFELTARKRSYAVTGVPLLERGRRAAGRRPHLPRHHRPRAGWTSVRRDFVANASHELRTPLTSIRGFVEALEDGAMNEPKTAERFLGKIRVHADRMAALVEDLLELSRLESGADGARLRAHLAGARSPKRWLRPSPSAPPPRASSLACARRRTSPSSTDGERLRRIVENLVDNAVKYTPEGGMVTVVISAGKGGGARIEVRDDRPGHRRRAPAAHLRALLPRRQGAQPRPRRHRPRPRHRQAPRREPGRHGGGRQRARARARSFRHRPPAPFRAARNPRRPARASIRRASTKCRAFVTWECHEGRSHHQVVHAQGGAVPRPPGSRHAEPAARRAAVHRLRPHPEPRGPARQDGASCKAIEHDGDQITREVFDALNSTFITPFDREDIRSIASTSTTSSTTWRAWRST